MGKRVNSEQFGLFASEAEILDLADGGMNAGDIAKKIGKRIGYVDKIIAQYHGGDGNGWIVAARGGSATLGEAISRSFSLRAHQGAGE